MRANPAVAFALLGLAAAPACAEPVIVAGAITSAVVDVTRPAAAPSIDLTIKGTADSISIVLQGPSGQQQNEYFQVTDFPAHTSLRGYSAVGSFGFANNAFSLYTQAGTWSLVNLQICGPSGCAPPYTGAALAALFPSLTFMVRNPNKPDMQAPVVKQGKIETKIVSLASQKPVKIRVLATDDVSGVASVNITATLTGGDASISAAIFQYPHPARRADGTAESFFPLPPSTGTYTITNVMCADLAGNTRQYSDPGSINAIFDNQTSFTVVP